MDARFEAQLALGLVSFSSSESLLFPNFCTLCAADFACFPLQILFLYMLRAVNRYVSRYRFFPEIFPENFTVILLFFLFIQLSVCLRHLSAGTVLCALIRHPLAGYSVLCSLRFLQLLLIFFSVKEGPHFSPPPVSRADICSFKAGLHRSVPKPMRGALFLAAANA